MAAALTLSPSLLWFACAVAVVLVLFLVPVALVRSIAAFAPVLVAALIFIKTFAGFVFTGVTAARS